MKLLDYVYRDKVRSSVGSPNILYERMILF
jgi:hypothetical protein